MSENQKQRGRPVTKGLRPTYPLRLPPDLRHELEIYAALVHRPLSDIIEGAISSWWDGIRDTNAKMAREGARANPIALPESRAEAAQATNKRTKPS